MAKGNLQNRWWTDCKNTSCGGRETRREGEREVVDLGEQGGW